MSRAINAGTGNFIASAALPKLRYFGYAARNIGNDAATVVITHGAAGPVLATINLSPKQMTQEWLEPGGVSAPDGIFVVRSSGATQVQVFMRS